MIVKSLDAQNINVEVDVYSVFPEIVEKLKNLIDNKKIGLNYVDDIFSSSGLFYGNILRVGEYNAIKRIAPNAEFVPAGPIILKLRSKLVGNDVKIVKDAVKGTLEILERVPTWVKPGLTELELKAKIHYEILKMGKPSFPAIVATGPNSADPHHNSSSKKIGKGALMVDMGINISEIKSDLTWTYWVGPEKPPEEFIQAYEALYESKITANEYMVAGNHIVFWDAHHRDGRIASSGVYIYRIRAGDVMIARKMLLLK